MVARQPSPTSDLPLLALRAEGGPGRGAGHLARCLALAQAWIAKGGVGVLVSTSVPEPWASRYRDAGVTIAETGVGLRAHWWVVDGYDLADEGRPDGAHLGRIDDHGLSPGGAVELVIDQNLGASADPYAGRAAELLLGPRYALVRGELVSAAAGRPGLGRQPSGDDDALRLVVIMGGAPSVDVERRMDQVVDAVRGDRLVVEVLRGGADPVEALRRADLALAAAGSTVWELCLFGIPSVLVSVAANQEPLALELARRGAAVDVGRLADSGTADLAGAVRDLAASTHRRAALRDAMRQVVDGHGAARVASRLRAALIDLRPVEASDLEAVYELNNEPGARSASFASEPIAHEDHVAWFDRMLASPERPMYLAADHLGRPLGLVRFAIDAGSAEIGLVIAPEQRGRGWGGALIDAGVRRVAGEHPVREVIASVKASNVASQRAFVDADFDRCTSEDPEVLRYARRHVRPVSD